MSRTRISAGIAASVALGTLGLLPLAGVASADPSFSPGPNDVVGVGSDTTEYALTYLADGATIDGVDVAGWNDGHAYKLASWNATGSATIVPRTGTAEITRPNGSGAGKTTLYNPSNPAISFARSSSTLSPAEVAANLYQVPFAVDGLKLAVKQTGSHAPTAITAADMVHIYDGSYDTWNDIPGNEGGSTAAIKPMIPQSGSGTRSFFVSQLKAANGGVDVTLAGTVQEVQEHDPAPIAADADAIAPFSTGRAKTVTGIKLETGFSAERGLYNVVRQADLNTTWFAEVFGEGGFVCSTAARPLIEKAGFDQLAIGADGGVCGQPTQAATTNFTTNQRVANLSTTTVMTGAVSKQTVNLKATVSAASSTPEGEVQFFDGATPVGAATPLSGGVALLTLTKVTPGTHRYTAQFASADAGAWPDSTSAVRAVVVKASSKMSVTMPSKIKAGTQAKASVKVSAAGKAATGVVKVTKSGKVLAKKTLKAGKATLTLPKLRVGKYSLVVSYGGNSRTLPTKVTKTLKVVR